jgi:hypothetical protein
MACCLRVRPSQTGTQLRRAASLVRVTGYVDRLKEKSMNRKALRFGVAAAALVLVGACGTKDETNSTSGGDVGAGNTTSTMSSPTTTGGAPTMTTDSARRDSTGMPTDTTRRDTTTRKP